MEVKYEAVFGDQAMFDDAHNEATHATSGHGFYKVNEDGLMEYLSNGVMNGNKNETLTAYLIAERRIIRTPTWSVADQKAGKLPAVGSKAVSVHGFCVVDILAVRNGCVVACNSDVIDSRPCVFTVDNFLEIFKPIETPEEKAARLRDEWCRECKSKLYPRGRDGFPERIYDALLSGDLPVPVKE